MNARLDWDRDGQTWPNRTASRFVEAGGLRWHVQVAGAGPAILLLHGMGAATHSWRGLIPLLTERFTVIAPDLPGHGFSGMPDASLLSLPGMAHATGDLLRALDIQPEWVVGHSAGAAVMTRMALDGAIAPKTLFSLNGALLPLRSLAAQFFSPTARLLARLPMVPPLFTFFAGDRPAVARLIRETGSTIDAEGLRCYALLMRNPGHVEGTLGMMAKWDLPALARDLPALRAPLMVIASRNDRTVPPSEALRVRARVPHAKTIVIPDLGHLAHEERPDLIAASLFPQEVPSDGKREFAAP
jgi:magnesium chelatase accessory protein